MEELVSDGITPFNITFVSESSAQALALKVSQLVTMESRGAVMPYTDVRAFQQNESTFPATTTACMYSTA